MVAQPEGAAEPSTEKPEKEKPAFYWVFRARKKDKWAKRREKRKLRDLKAKEAKEAEAGEEGVEAKKKSVEEPPTADEENAAGSKQKRKAGEATEAAEAANVEEAADAAEAAEAAEAASGEASRKRRRKAGGEADKIDEGKEGSGEAAEKKANSGKDAKDEATSAEVTEMERSFRPPGFFSEMRFEDLAICEPLKRGLNESKFETLTEIQAKTIPHLLNGKDVLAAAKTGSGKTLAFLVPAIDMLYNVKFLPRNGVGSLVISPTRELAMQIYDVLRNLSRFVSQSFAVVVGGMNRRTEVDRLGKGINSLVGTPGRLLDHMQNTRGFVYHNLVTLTIDEADRILEVGFEDEMNLIIKLLPAKRQTALFSATQTRKVADLARLSLTKPIFVEVKSQDNVATVSGLTQGYVVVPAQSRFLLLFTFLKKNKDKKIMVFFSSCNSVKYHDELLNYIDIPVTCIHGHKKQASRSTTYYTFCAASKGILLCTDVAARGLDIPRVDWIVQYDPPDEPKEYIHRVGRTARGAEGVGKALLFLMPEELGFLQYLRRAGVPVSEYSFPPNKIANIQNQLERVLDKNYHLHCSSRSAYRAYMHAYAAHAHKDCYDVHKLDLLKVAKGFGFAFPPKVELNLKHTPKRKPPMKNKLSATATGHVFSASNPFGKRPESDKRQFVR